MGRKATTEGRVFWVVRDPGDNRPVAELVAEQCNGEMPTELDTIIVREILDERLDRVHGRAEDTPAQRQPASRLWRLLFRAGQRDLISRTIVR